MTNVEPINTFEKIGDAAKRVRSAGFKKPDPQHSASRPIIKRNEITR